MAESWDKVKDAAVAWADRAIRPITPPDPAAKVGHLAVDPKNKDIRERLTHRVDAVIEEAANGALDGMVKGVSRPTKRQGFVVAIWSAGAGFYVANVIPYVRTVTLSELFQLGIIVFIPTAVIALVVDTALKRVQRRRGH